MLGFPFNISATAEASDFKFGTLLGFAKGHHKITPREKPERGPGLGELLNIFGPPYALYVKLLTQRNLVADFHRESVSFTGKTANWRF